MIDLIKKIQSLRSKIIKWQTPYYHQLKPSNYCCCCGFNYEEDIHRVENGDVPYTKCELCGVCHGDNDSSLHSLLKFRIRWLSTGLPIAYPNDIPQSSESNPILTLKNIDIDFTNPKTVEEYKKDIPNIEEIIKPWIDKMSSK